MVQRQVEEKGEEWGMRGLEILRLKQVDLLAHR